MKVYIHRLYENGVETGVILTAFIPGAIDINQKSDIESQLQQHCFDVLYPGEGLRIYSSVNKDEASVTVFRNPETITI